MEVYSHEFKTRRLSSVKQLIFIYLDDENIGKFELIVNFAEYGNSVLDLLNEYSVVPNLNDVGKLNKIFSLASHVKVWLEKFSCVITFPYGDTRTSSTK